eukprot:3602092-Amphidinium_carterae.1
MSIRALIFDKIGHRVYIKAAVMTGYYNNIDYTKEFANWYNERYDNFNIKNMVVYVNASGDDPHIPMYGDCIMENKEEQTKKNKTHQTTSSANSGNSKLITRNCCEPMKSSAVHQ